MTLRDPAWFRSARARPAAFAALVLLSLAAVLVSALTPMLLAALDAATLREGVARATLPRDGVIGITQVNQNDDAVTAAVGLDNILSEVDRGSGLWSDARSVAESKDLLKIHLDAKGTSLAPTLFSVTVDGCAGLTLTSGRCPRREYEVAVPVTTARERGWRPGRTLQADVPGSIDPVDLHVVGIYDDRRGAGVYVSNPTVLQGARTARSVPNLLMDDSAFVVFKDDYQITGSRQVVRPVRQRDVPVLRAGIAAAELGATTPDAGIAQGKTISELPDLLDDIAREQGASAVLMTPIGLAGLVLAWYALFVVAQRSARARAVEWGIDRTRGLRVRAWLSSVFTEPVIAVLVGAVIGYPVAVLVATGASTAVLGTATGLAPFAVAPVAAGALALVGSVAALAAASVRAALLPLNELLQDTVEARRATRVALVGRVALLTLTAAVVWVALRTTAGSGSQLGLLLPVLVALVVGLGARLVAVLLVRRTASRVPRGLSTLVVGRGLARAPSGLAAVQLLLVAVAVAAYVLQVQAASAAVQTDRAELEVGAPQVLTVAVPQNASLLDAVRRADPAGRTAMAAIEVGSGSPGAAHVIAVDTRRLDAVGEWRPGWRPGVDLARLRTPSGRDLVLRGSRLTMSIVAQQNVGDGVPPGSRVRLTAVLATPSAGWRRVPIGATDDGALQADIPCSDGCRLVSIAVGDTGPGADVPWGVGFVVTAIATDRQPATALRPWLTASRWRSRTITSIDPEQPATVGTEPWRSGLKVSVQDHVGGLAPELEPAVGPADLPVVAGTSTPVVTVPASGGAVLGNALSTETIRMRRVGLAPALPRVLRDGVLADLGAASRVSDPSSTLGVQQVWLTAGAHPGVVAALQRQGVRVLGHRDAATAVRSALSSATHRALVLTGTTAAAGLLFALLALAATRIVDAPARRREWAVLRLAGASRRRLRRLAAVQLLAPAAVAVVLGVGSGLLAGAITLAGLPLLVGRSPGPPLDATPPLAALLALVGLMLALAAGIAAGAAALDLPGRRS